MAATCMAVCKGSRKKIRGIFISSCHLPVAVECDIVILSEPGPIPQAPVGQFCRHNLSPRGDGNVFTPDELKLPDTTQLIPARGRKLGVSSRRDHYLRHNLSPRGDGNWCWTTMIPWSKGHNLSPRGDGNKSSAQGAISIWRHNLSPRGDGNSIPRTIILNVSRHNLSPRGDGNNHFYSPSRFEKDTTYPREGTETGLFRPEI